MLNRRTQLLLDDSRYTRLDHRARATGQSVAAVIREAIDDKLAAVDEAGSLAEAGAWLLAQPLPSKREPDWDDAKRRMLDDAGATPGA
ncbi:MAG TPA: ribbon-helix-helix domain-containing protein [Conexibacter sp.]|nr:ribbon-helix-helix domain-containing protein [Conexibacter sp.]